MEKFLIQKIRLEADKELQIAAFDKASYEQANKVILTEESVNVEHGYLILVYRVSEA